MRLVHEYNREKVERWLRRQRLEKIATLEECDRQNLLSDRRMLADEYDGMGMSLLFEDPRAAEAYFRKALEVCQNLPDCNELDLRCLKSQIQSAMRFQLEREG